jgi:outer membrane immunogenic protein
MKKHLVSTLASTLVFSAMAVATATSAFAADATNLSGFSVGTTAEFSSGAANATDGTSDTGKTTGLGLQARYDWAVAPNFAVGLGASYSSGNHQAGTYASGNAATVNSRYSLDVIPTYALPNNFQVFGKVSSIYGSAAADDGVNTANVQGVGYGVGVRKMVDKNVYWQVGYDVNKFNDVTFATGTTSSLKENVFSLGVGYKF